MTHPYSIYVWQPPVHPLNSGNWSEPAQCFNQEWALYIANLMHQDSKAVIKVVRYGHNLLCLPNEHAVHLVERQIKRRRKPRTTDDFEPEITYTENEELPTD